MSKSVVKRPEEDSKNCYKCGNWPATIVITHKKRRCEDCPADE